MNVIDSSLWIAIVADKERAPDIVEIMNDWQHLLVPSLCIFEVYRKILRDFGEEEALRVVAFMRRGIVIDLDADLALFAAEISQQLSLPMADSVILATARQYGATLWTMDSDFRGIEGVRFLDRRSGKGKK